MLQRVATCFAGEAGIRRVAWAAGGFWLAAVLVNLGLMPLLADEPIRALVSLEMLLREDFLVPTMRGELYTHKPPLYNWLLAGVFALTGDYSEWMIRFVALLSFAGLGLLTWRLGRASLGDTGAVVAGVGAIVCVQITIYDSMLGHIDPFYAIVSLLQMVAIYYYGSKNRPLAMFLVSWGLCAAGFMLKALPSVLFQGAALLAFALATGRWRVLFDPLRHGAGVLLFLTVVVGYFGAYSLRGDLPYYVDELLFQSTQRTPLHYDWKATALQLAAFLPTLLGQTAPLSVGLVFLLNRQARAAVWGDPFLRFCALCVAINLPPYWLSPGTNARYLFMFYPMIAWLGVAAWRAGAPAWPRLEAALRWVGVGLCVLGAGAAWAVFLIPEQEAFTALAPKCMFLTAALLALAWFAWRQPLPAAVTFLLFLAAFRLGFSWFVLPHRYLTSKHPAYRQAAMDVVRIADGKPLVVLGYTPVNLDIAYYITERRREILYNRQEQPRAGVYYIVTEDLMAGKSCRVLLRFETKYQNTRLFLVQFDV